jgi:prepilin-type N-terminal cleavage/methylation domain-containing protein
MNDITPRSSRRRGFTILELLVVISIIAVIATMATGAAIKALKQSRVRRIEAMQSGLEIALANYRAKENAWPFDLSDFVQDNNDKTRYWIHGENNQKALKKMYHGEGGQSQTIYLDAAAYLTTVSGKRMPLRTALNLRRTDAAIGYLLPDNPNRFCYFCLCYNPLTDTVKVYREDTKHKNAGGGEFICPEWKNK